MTEDICPGCGRDFHECECDPRAGDWLSNAGEDIRAIDRPRSHATDTTGPTLSERIADLEQTADRLTGHGLSGLVTADWPVLVAALEDYIGILKGVEGWDKSVQAAVDAVDERAALVTELAEALEGVVRVADRKTNEFDAARAAITKYKAALP